MTRPPRYDIYVTSKDIEEIAYECFAERRKPGQEDTLVQVTPELLLAVADKLRELEDAHEAADTAIFDDSTKWPDSEEDVQ